MADGKTGAEGSTPEGADAKATDAHVGQRLRQRRWMLGMTQLQVGNRVGIKFQQVQKYETGQNRISASRLWDLAKALDVPVGYFFEGLPEAPTGSAPIASVDGEPAPAGGDPMADRESIELIRSYYAIAEEPRRRLFELAKAMSEAERLRQEEAEPAENVAEDAAEPAFLNGREKPKARSAEPVRLKAG